MSILTIILLYISLGGVVGIKTLNDPSYYDTIDIILGNDKEANEQLSKFLHNKYLMLSIFIILGVPLVISQFIKSQ